MSSRLDEINRLLAELEKRNSSQVTTKDIPKPDTAKENVIVRTSEAQKGEREVKRKFYYINLRMGSSCYFLGATFDRYRTGNIYGDFRFRNIVVQRKSLFRDELILELPYCLYAYEENGTFYEFFSGKPIGERGKGGSSYYTTDNNIVRKGYVLTSFEDFGSNDCTIRELSAVQFSNAVEQYVPYKSHMASEMSRLLDALDANYKRLTDAANAKRNAEIRAEQSSQSWLDDIINSR